MSLRAWVNQNPKVTPIGGGTDPVKHWHAKQSQQIYGHCAAHIPGKLFAISPRSCASESTHPPRVQAASVLLDRGWGKAPQAHTGVDDKDIHVTIRQIVECRDED